MAHIATVQLGSDSESLDSSLNPSTSPPSPLLQLPPEILSRIFACVCHADFYKTISRKDKHIRTTPFVLGKIYGRWRDIVQCTPYVWSHIYLSLSVSRYENQVDLFEECLCRSGACLLTINLTFDNEDLWSRRMPTRLIEVLVSSSKRWQVINSTLPEGWFSHLEGITEKLAALTTASTVSLRSDFRLSPSKPKRNRLTLFSLAPLLSELNLNGYYLTDVDVPWSQLTRLTLKRVYTDECFYALLRTPHLTYCRISTILQHVGRETVKTDLDLSFLQFLNIHDAQPDDMAVILDCLLAPIIETLEIFSPKAPLNLGIYARLITKTGCENKLRVLKLQHEFTFCGSEDELLGFLDTFPNLEDLRISLSFNKGQPLWKFVIKLLAEEDREEGSTHRREASSDFNDKTYNKTTYRLLKLERFSLKGNIVPPSKPDRALIDAIINRWEGQCRENTSELPFVRLRYLDLAGNSTDLEPNDYQDHMDFFKSDVAQLQEKGMNIRIKLNPKWPLV